MSRFASIADRDRIEAEMPYAARPLPKTIYAFLSRTRALHPQRPALGFQLLSDPKSRKCELTWTEFHERVTEAANLFRSLGVGPGDTVAYLLPNCLETPTVLLAGATAGIVNPINPLLEPEQIASILRESNAKVLVTLKSMPKTDVAQKAAAALEMAPCVQTVLEVDLAAASSDCLMLHGNLTVSADSRVEILTSEEVLSTSCRNRDYVVCRWSGEKQGRFLRTTNRSGWFAFEDDSTRSLFVAYRPPAMLMTVR